LLGRNVILVFFRGIECSHCTRALKTLVRAVCDEGVVDAEIVAVSAQALGDVEQAARELNPKKKGRFHLVANESQDAFRKFDCWRADDVAHGLFVIDSAGRIRGRYIGQSPFEDAAAVARCVTRLSPPRP
jgi:peroxiredoxin